MECRASIKVRAVMADAQKPGFCVMWVGVGHEPCHTGGQKDCAICGHPERHSATLEDPARL
jgi:hypothetical protein